MDEENSGQGTKETVDDRPSTSSGVHLANPASDEQNGKRRKQNSTSESFSDLTDQRNDENRGDGPEDEIRGDAEGRLLVKLAEMSPSCPIGCLLKVLRDVLAGVLVKMGDNDIIMEAITRAEGLETGMKILEDRLPGNHEFLIDRFIGIRQIFSDRKPEVVAEQMISLAVASPAFDPGSDDVEDRVNGVVEALFLNPPIGSAESAPPTSSTSSTGSAPEFPLPDHWSPTPGWSLVDIPADSDEYAMVANAFRSNKIRTTIVKITRVQNPGLWRQYQLKRSLILEKVGQWELNERHLWHGTSLNIAQTISLQGFDFRVDVKNGRAYGDGTYFAPNPSLAITYAEPSLQAPALGARWVASTAANAASTASSGAAWLLNPWSWWGTTGSGPANAGNLPSTYTTTAAATAMTSGLNATPGVSVGT